MVLWKVKHAYDLLIYYENYVLVPQQVYFAMSHVNIVLSRYIFLCNYLKLPFIITQKCS